MKNARTKEVFIDCLKKYRHVFIMLLLLIGIEFCVFRLYNIMLEPLSYAVVLCLVLLVIMWANDFVRMLRAARQRDIMSREIKFGNTEFPEPESMLEQDYQDVVRELQGQIRAINSAADAERRDALDYLTTWVHQIKTPISVMRMTLSETENNTTLNSELFRIEQYVEMVLQYIRLGSSTNDLVIREYNLDELIRRTIRKCASQFIARKLGMNFEPTGIVITTDEKWFCCILEQLISNAIKYTPAGEIHIYLNEKDQLCISDTGIGIAPEDLPRIFEKGYTGINGRVDKRASGLGLYLVKQSANKLAIPIKAQSKVGEGSTFILDLSGARAG